MRTRLITQPLFLILSLLLTSHASAWDEYDQLMEGTNAKQRGDLSAAVKHYLRFISSSPVVTTKQLQRRGNERTNKATNTSRGRQPSVDNPQYHLRNLIIAYTNLHSSYRKLGQELKAAEVANKLRALPESGRLGSKNNYKIAMFLLDEGEQADATQILQNIIADQINDPLPHNNKVALRSYAKLAKWYRDAGQIQQLQLLLAELQNQFPAMYHDINDKYAAASILLEHGHATEHALTMLNQVHDSYLQTLNPRQMKTALKAFVKMVKTYKSNGNKQRLSNLIRKTLDSSAYDSAPWNDRYRLGATIANYTGMDEGIAILKDVTTRAPYSMASRKSLFALGRHAQARKQWDQAIGHYSDYIKRFPNGGFFTLKAYSRMLDAHFSRDGYTPFLEKEMQSFANIVNDIADYEEVLNLARDMKWKGWDELADASFEIGLNKAQAHIGQVKGSADEIRTRWIVEKYAYALERKEVVNDNARAILSLTETLKHKPMRSSQRAKIRYIKGQSRLWLAKTAYDDEALDKLETQLSKFISENPGDPDVDYAWFQLGKAHERRKDQDKARRSFRKVKKGVWKTKAHKRIQDMDDGIKD